VTQCTKHAPVPPTPPSLTLEAAAMHPRYKHLLEPGAQCEREAGHEEPHRCGLLRWYDPTALFVGGERVW